MDEKKVLKELEKYIDVNDLEIKSRNDFFKQILILSTTILTVVVSFTIFISLQSAPKSQALHIESTIDVLKILIILLAVTVASGAIAISEDLYLSKALRKALWKEIESAQQTGDTTTQIRHINTPKYITISNYVTIICFSLSILLLAIVGVIF